MDSLLSEVSKFNVGMHQVSAMSPFAFAVVVDVLTSLAGEGVLGEMLYADDLILMGVTIMGLRNTFIKWKEAFESKGLKVDFGKTKVIVIGGITMDGLSDRKVDPCGVYSLKAMANLALCVQCGMKIHRRCA